MSQSLREWRAAALCLIATLVAASSLAAFAESYRGLYDWSTEHGLSGFWSDVWPLQLDVFIAVGELALFVAMVDGWSRRARIGAWSVTLAGAVVSTAGNIGHVAGHDALSRLTGGVPPLAAAGMLAVALGILKRVVRAAPASEVSTGPVADSEPAALQSPPPAAVPSARAGQPREGVAAPKRESGRDSRRAADERDLRKIRELLAADPALTIATVERECDTRFPRAKRLLNEARNASGEAGAAADAEPDRVPRLKSVR